MISNETVFYKRLFFAVAIYNFLAVIVGLIYPSFLPFEASTDQEKAVLSLLLIGIFVMGVGALLLAINPMQNYAMAVIILLTKIAGILFAMWTTAFRSIFPLKYLYLSLVNDLAWIPFVSIYVFKERRLLFSN